MKNSLDQLSIQDFVNMLCGEIDVLKESPKEIFSEDRIKEAVRGILMEYREITSPGGQRNYIMETAALLKEKGRIVLFSVCKVLTEAKEFDRVREILGNAGIRCKAFSDERLTAEVSSRLARARDSLARLEKEAGEDDYTPDKIRKDFDSQTASLMAHFKFQINPLTIRASIYANLVARFNREIKEIEATIKKIKKK